VEEEQKYKGSQEARSTEYALKCWQGARLRIARGAMNAE
jgi:hypothetical protein